MVQNCILLGVNKHCRFVMTVKVDVRPVVSRAGLADVCVGSAASSSMVKCNGQYVILNRTHFKHGFRLVAS